VDKHEKEVSRDLRSRRPVAKVCTEEGPYLVAFQKKLSRREILLPA